MTDDAPPPPRAAERVLRALADAVGESRPRVAGDLADPDIPVAATVILARDAAEGLEVLLIERPDRGSFAGAWVFPGGKLDPADAGADATPSEEADARRAAVRETLEETGLVVDPGDLVPLSCWDPPPGLPLRIRTWFFAARAPGGELRLEPREAVTARWMRPADALRGHARGELTLYPPTWVTLTGLTEAVDVEGLLGATRVAGVRIFETQVRRGAEGPVFFWREDEEYDREGGPSASGARHRLEVGALPWIYTRDF
ncbi:NUDIX hydrolase [Microbacterium sp. DT81.1]|uniref:NUDIX hydrolase n=1 Tax=Microbacterium sp. DT81.1 TaxID=3393413 RepID=UPI003CEB3D0E